MPSLAAHVQIRSFNMQTVLLLLLPLLSMSLFGEDPEQPPQYLYKVLSMADWDMSQKGSDVVLSEEDKVFVHLAKEDQLDRIIQKFWKDIPEFMVLKLLTASLKGQLVYEVNPGGENKYYHLYNGSIPMQAVVETKLIKR